MAAPTNSRFRFYAILSLMVLTCLILISQVISFPTATSLLPSTLQRPFPGTDADSHQQQGGDEEAAGGGKHGGDKQPGPNKPPSFRNYTSAHSFDADAAAFPDWMARLPDSASLASLSIPGTHDTLTHRLADQGYQCQNLALGAQLRAGVRYLDLRLRLGAAGDLLVYHAAAYTGYAYADVLLAAFAFLDAHPREGLVLRVKEEGPPVDDHGDGDARPGPLEPGTVAAAGSDVVNSTRTFEEAFNYYRLEDPRTAPGCAKHLLLPAARSDRAAAEQGSETEMPIPTLGELRGRALVLQEFDSAAPYGIPWLSGQLALEDYWVVANASFLDDKWDAIRENLELAAAASPSRAGDGAQQEPPRRLYLSHLSASVGVLPIEAAAGPLDHPSIAGMNDRTGRWLAAPGHNATAGIVIADFPGRALVEAILSHNEWLVDRPQPQPQPQPRRRARRPRAVPVGARL
ncbi:uncharacterized protein E0L32_007287 [Thyridium curvatum]|uniref:Phosphatidylinositol-specific phospholipase C X domain-containing protein n=1 Tax=Thyridium curvatum TaxID=1093900 RepID=A0A507AZV7_9PEZI|nr:uncharacterized protein E0L32_007287 [Thyridium curvatum]TPX11984.1 hypothetical protein E0L32_007287 [Thyridium curvatum]